MIAFQVHQHCRADRQTLYVAFDACDFDQVTLPKGLLTCEQDAGQHVLDDVAKCNAEDEPHDTRAAEHGCSQSRQSSDAQGEVNTEHEDDQPRGSGGELRTISVPRAAGTACAKSRLRTSHTTPEHNSTPSTSREGAENLSKSH